MGTPFPPRIRGLRKKGLLDPEIAKRSGNMKERAEKVAAETNGSYGAPEVRVADREQARTQVLERLNHVSKLALAMGNPMAAIAADRTLLENLPPSLTGTTADELAELSEPELRALFRQIGKRLIDAAGPECSMVAPAAKTTLEAKGPAIDVEGEALDTEASVVSEGPLLGPSK